MKRILLIAGMLIFISLPAFAHPGSTDSQGGHYDHSTGVYHFHHGYSAHFHINGICPYDFDDKTGQNPGSSSSSSMGSYSFPKVTATPSPGQAKSINQDNTSSVLGGAAVGIAAATILRWAFSLRT